MAEQALSFGEWLTRRRKALNLTRAALAQQVPCAIITLRRLEADDLRASIDLARHLARVLQIPDDQRAAFSAFARGEQSSLIGDVAAPARATTHSPRLPAALTRLIGRKTEVTAIAETLRQPGVRLLTLTGPPGTGKARLGLAVAEKLAYTFSDGVHFVPLAPITDPEFVAAAIAQQLGLNETRSGAKQAVLDFLPDKRLLLVLDNFEHLIPAAPLVTELLIAAPQIKVLATSREILHLYGEHEFPVPPLVVSSEQSKVRLHNLVDKNLVRYGLVLDGEVRYSMLETMHEYALDQLTATGELDRARQWHADYYLTFMQTARPHLLQGDDQLVWFERVARATYALTPKGRAALEADRASHPIA